MAFHEIEYLMPLKETAYKTRMFWTLLKDQGKSYFEYHLRRKLEAEDSEIPDNELIEIVLRDIGLEYILSIPHKCKSIISGRHKVYILDLICLYKKLFQTLLKVQGKSYFKLHLRRKLDTEDSEIPDNELIEIVLGNMSLEYTLSTPYKCKSIISGRHKAYILDLKRPYNIIC
jgi:hypothetical protein